MEPETETETEVYFCSAKRLLRCLRVLVLAV